MLSRQELYHRYRFANALESIRRRIITTKGNLAGNGFNPNTDDIDLDSIWNAMNGRKSSVDSQEALDLTYDRRKIMDILYVISENECVPEDSLAVSISENESCSVGAAKIIIGMCRNHGLKMNVIRKEIEKMAEDEKPCIIRGVEIDPTFAIPLALAFDIGPRANVSVPTAKHIDKVTARNILESAEEVLSMKNPDSDILQDTFADLKKIDPTITGDSTSKKGIAAHTRRIYHRYWYHTGVYAKCHEYNLRHIVAKTINFMRISDKDYKMMRWAFFNAAHLAGTLKEDIEINEHMVQVAESLLDTFNTAFDKYSKDRDLVAYVSLAFEVGIGIDALEAYADKFSITYQYAQKLSGIFPNGDIEDLSEDAELVLDDVEEIPEEAEEVEDDGKVEEGSQFTRVNDGQEDQEEAPFTNLFGEVEQ